MELATHKQALRGLAITLAVLAGALILLYILHQSGALGWLTPERQQEFRHFVQHLGWWGPVILIGLMVALILLMWPSIELTLLSGFLYDKLGGFAIVMTADAIAMALAFLICRHLLRSRFEHWLENKPFIKRIDEGVSRQGWRLVLLTRILPVSPFPLLNYAYGLTRLSFGAYLAASLAGIAPVNIMYLWMGDSIRDELTGDKLDFHVPIYLALVSVATGVTLYWPEIWRRISGKPAGSHTPGA